MSASATPFAEATMRRLNYWLAVLAATAFRHDLVLVTRNVGDYQDLGVTILNP